MKHDHSHHSHHDHSCCSIDPTKKADTPVTQADKERIYTCPMHPEVRQQGPGNCPLCGMALEPEEVSLEDSADRKSTRLNSSHLDLSRMPSSA